jgi:hypothetical protein
MTEANENATPAERESKPGDIVISPPAARLSWADLPFRTAGELLNFLPSSWANRSIPALIELLQRIQSRRGRTRPGRRAVYDIPAIIAVAKEASVTPDNTLDWFVDRVRGLLEVRGIRAPKDTRLTELCAPIYKRAKEELPTISD